MLYSEVHSLLMGLRKTFFSVVHRIHWSRSRLAQVFPVLTMYNYVRYKSGPANLTHMFLTCPSLSLFWHSAFNSLSAIWSVTVPHSPLTALFGILPDAHSLPSHFRELVAFVTLLAIFICWNDPHPPTHSITLDKRSPSLYETGKNNSLRDCDNKFLKV